MGWHRCEHRLAGVPAARERRGDLYGFGPHPRRRSRGTGAHGRRQADRGPDSRRKAPTGPARAVRALAGRRAPSAGEGRVDHTVDRDRRAVLARRSRGDRGRGAPARHAAPRRRRAHRKRGRRARERPARRDDRCRRRRAFVRWNEERHDVRRGRGVLPTGARRQRARGAEAARAASVEGALHLRAAARPARRRSVARVGDARQRHGRAARDEGRRSAGGAAVAPPGGQQRVCAVAARRDQGTAGVVLLLHVGRGRARSAVDDGVGHQSGGCRRLRRGCAGSARH